MNAPLPASTTTLGPDSLIWRYFGDSRVLLFLGTGFILQVAHPVIGKGVGDHSSFKTDPYGRLQRSLDLLWPCVYNTPVGVAEYGRKLREMHRNIRGTGYDGKPYHALAIEPYMWVHITAYMGFLDMAEFVGDELTAAQKQQLFDEWLQMGRQLGIRDQDMPQDIPSYWTYVNRMIDERLERNETLDYLCNEEYFRRQSKPPLKWLPTVLWKPIGRFGGSVAWLCARASMPESFRRKFDISWTGRDARRYRRVSLLLRTIWPLLPERARWVPQAWRAIRDARANPGSYALSSPATGHDEHLLSEAR